MASDYTYSLLKDILNTKINGKSIWKKRISHQMQFIHLLEAVFETDIATESFGFYPNRVYFATPLTSDPKYTQAMKSTWNKIITVIEKFNWDVYAPFATTDPHAKSFDMLDSYQIRDLDHSNILKAEIVLIDLNRPSHGVGQEIEMSLFIPTIGFSKERVSRMTKGMPGFMTLTYKDEKELVTLLKKIFERKDYKKEPFYLARCPHHKTQSIFKGEVCLLCAFSTHLHIV